RAAVSSTPITFRITESRWYCSSVWSVARSLWLALGGFTSTMGANLRDHETLDRAFGVLVFFERHRDGVAPELRRARVRELLAGLPRAGKPSEHGAGRLDPDARAAVLAHHEELRHVVRVAGADDGEPSRVVVEPEEERVALV